MASDLRDPLGRALDGLRDDVAQAPLPAPAQIRARGDRRSRRQRAALGAGSVLAVAAIAVTGSTLPGVLQPDRSAHPAPPAGTTPSSTPAPSVLTSPSTTSGAQAPSATPTTARPRPVIDVTPVGVGDVPRQYFLPGRLWTGPDLVHGQKISSIEPKEFEGSVQRFVCDPDPNLTGDVAFVQAVRSDGTIAGTQKVRLESDSTTAAGFVSTSVDALVRCEARLVQQAQKDAANLPPGETAPTPTAEVTEDAASRVDDPTGSVRLFRTVTDYGTGAGSRLIEWVAVAREGSAVTFVSLNQFEKGDVSFEALGRIAREARAQMAWAATQR